MNPVRSFIFAILALGAGTPAHGEEADASFESESVTIYGRRTRPATLTLEGSDLDKIRQSGNLSEALEKESGLELSGLSGAKAFSSLSIRGADSKHTLILVNGQKLGEKSSLGDLPSEDILRIEVLKGPEALAYGSEALGGVVLISTRKPGEGQGSWELGATRGAFGAWQAGLSSAPLTLGPWRGVFSARSHASDGYVSNTDERGSELGHSSTLNLGQNSLDLRVNYVRRSGGAPFAQSLAAQGNGDFDDDDRQDQWRVNSSLSGIIGIGDWDLKPALRSGTHVIERANPIGEDAEAGVARNNADQLDNHSLRLPLSRHFGSVDLGMALEAGRESLLSALHGWHARDQAGASIRLAVPLASLRADVSLREDYRQGFDPAFNPSASLNWELAPGKTLSLSSGLGWRVPELSQLHHPQVPFNVGAPEGFGKGEKGNPGLKPERSLNNQLSADFVWPALSSSSAAYANFVSDLIQLRLDDDDEFWHHANHGEARFLGAELSLKAHTPFVTPFANYTYVDAREVSGNALIPGRLRQKVAGGLTLSFLGTVELKTDYTWIERNPIFLPHADEDDIQLKIAYGTMNATLDAKFSAQGSVFVNFSNVLDQQASSTPGLPIRGRYAEAGVSLKF